MTAKKKEDEIGSETKGPDDLQNGGKGTVEERLAALEERFDNVVKRNHLLEADR